MLPIARTMIVLTAVLFLVAVVVVDARADKKIKLTLYYESLCPGCREFVADQLLPNYEHAKPYVDFVLVPFGHAKSSNDSSGHVHFECQHGPRECELNMLESCGLHLLRSKPFAHALAFVGCVESNASDRNCTAGAGIAPTRMHACTGGPLGVRLQLAAERQTARVRPYYVPTVVFDDRFDAAQSQRAVANLRAELCRLNKKMCETTG